VTQGDLLRALQFDPEGKISVLEAGASSLVVAHADERVFDAVTKMLENNIGRLPVVDRNDPQKMVGYINRATVMGSWRGHLHAESVRENGWLENFRSISDYEGNGGVTEGRVESLTDEQLLLTPNADSDEPANVYLLNAPVRGVLLGDRVRVSYQKNNGQKVAVRIEELSSRQ
jgi:CBS domain-containing protein